MERERGPFLGFRTLNKKVCTKKKKKKSSHIFVERDFRLKRKQLFALLCFDSFRGCRAGSRSLSLSLEAFYVVAGVTTTTSECDDDCSS